MIQRPPHSQEFDGQSRGVAVRHDRMTCRWGRLAVMLLAWVLVSTPSWGQDSESAPLHEREPFDRITLDDNNQNAVVEVFPVAELQANVPASLAGRQITIRRLQDPPDVRYSVDGRAIAKYERYQDLLLAEANRAIANDQMEQAFPLLARLNQVAPNMPGLKTAEEAFFFSDTRQLFRQRRYDESLLSLDQVFQRNPQRSGLDRALKNILSQILITEFAAENYDSVRAKLDFARRKYGSIAGPLIRQWETELEKSAQQQFATAQQLFAAGKASPALTALRRASDTWPSLEGITELRQEILAKFPRLRVGVSQSYEVNHQPHSPVSQLNWATRRSEALVSRRVRYLEEYTVDGARYVSDLGQIKVATDRGGLQLQLLPELSDSGHRIVQQLLRLADPSREGFSPRWAEYVQDLYLDGNTVQVRLTRPTLRPDGLLPTTLRASELTDLMRHQFTAQPIPDSQSISYLRVDSSAQQAISELTETVFVDPTEAADALLASRVDVVDRIHPADYDKLSASSDIRVIPYRLPTIHGLVFGDRKTIFRNATFRRGLLYGIDRATFVRQELSSSQKEISQPLSGFAPIGRSDNDPLGYAYNPDIAPRAYDPSLALVLMRLALRTQRSNESKGATDATPKTDDADNGEEPEDAEAPGDEAAPPADTALPELTLAYPDSFVAAAACEFIASNWRRLGIKVTLRPLQAGLAWPDDSQWDVLYIETTIEEPLVDLPELILGHQILGRHGGLIWHAMRQLQDASSFEELRQEFSKIHRLTFDHTPMLPLWQIIEHAAVQKGFQGLDSSPITLYEDVDQWRLVR